MTNWYAVYTRPQYEKKVAETFARKKIESYCPLNKIVRHWLGKSVQLPLFKSYVFVRLNQTQLQEVKAVDGVISLVSWLGKPAVIRDIEIDMIKRFLSVHKEIRLEKTPVNTTEMVKLTEGTRVQKEGGIIAIGAVGPRLLLPSLGYRLVAAQHTTQQNFTHQVISKQQDPLVNFG